MELPENKQRGGQSVERAQIVYYTKSDLNIVVMVQRYINIWFEYFLLSSFFKISS